VKTVLFFVIFPLLVAIILATTKNERIRGIVVRGATITLGITSVAFAAEFFTKPYKYYLVDYEAMNYLIIIIEVLVAGYIIYLSIKEKKYLITVLSFAQTVGMLWFETVSNHSSYILNHHIFVDKLTIIMAVIISIIGGLICIFALSYMKDYHMHHKNYKDRRRLYFSVLFVFLSAMYGIIFFNDLVWIYFFWEITTLCSFLLIGYTQTKEATENSFTALLMNLIGGAGFAGAIIYVGLNFGITELKDLIAVSVKGVNLVFPAILLGIAGLSKAAQLPFSKWLLGAMVAPTPTSALLHSSTMVKAGVYLLIRISPLFIGNIAGYMVMFAGGITFLLMSLIAISQSDGKKVLAYSTMANLGLIVACTGVGSYEAIWAAVMLIIFHAVAKSLMFLSVGTTEHVLGSRDIEDMHGLIVKLPEMALLMAIGIAGMFLAPFGMLISKWAALKAFIDTRNIILILFLVYGSAATLFYWTKWLGKLSSVLPQSERLECSVGNDQWIALIVHAILTVVLCILFPVISKYLIVPLLHDMFDVSSINIISNGNYHIMIIMLTMITVLPFGMRFLTSREEKVVTAYMSGINAGDNRNFKGSIGGDKRMYLSSWYMDNYFGEKKLLPLGIIICTALIISMVGIAIGGVI
jgi:ech hydrogenase subunit A